MSRTGPKGWELDRGLCQVCKDHCCHINTKNSEGEVKAYCCHHVPAHFINSRKSEWICTACYVRWDENTIKEGN